MEEGGVLVMDMVGVEVAITGRARRGEMGEGDLIVQGLRFGMLRAAGFFSMSRLRGNLLGNLRFCQLMLFSSIQQARLASGKCKKVVKFALWIGVEIKENSPLKSTYLRERKGT